MWRIDLHAIAESYFRLGVVAACVNWELIPVAPNSISPEGQIGHVAVALGSHRFILYGGRNVQGRRMISGTVLCPYTHIYVVIK
jgi:hypothetical protein